MSDFNILPADIKIDWKILHFYTAWNFQVLNIKSICDLQLGDLPFFGQMRLMIFFLFFFFQKIGYGISCRMSPLETVCMKCQNLFSAKKIRDISICHMLSIKKKKKTTTTKKNKKKKQRKVRLYCCHIFFGNVNYILLLSCLIWQ